MTQFAVQQKITQHFKSTILQQNIFKNKNLKLVIMKTK